MAMRELDMKTLNYFALPIIYLCFAACGGGGGSASPETSVPPPLLSSLSDSLDDYIEQNQSLDDPGLSVLVRKDGRVVYRRSRGLANRATGALINDRTGFRIGSVSKSFVALAIMQLVERGVLKLDDRLSTWVPDVSAAYGGITLLQLLSHQSGIPDYINDSDNLSPLDNLTTQAFVDMALGASASELEFSPGSTAQYSNTGYVILAVLIERATGFRFPDYMQFALYDELAMTDSFVINERRQMDEVGENVALSHGRTRDVYAIGREQQTFNALIYGSSGQVSSIEDMNAFFSALANGDIVSAETLATMREPRGQLPDIGDYGLGWITGSGRYWHSDIYTSPSDYWHSGGYGGYRSLLAISPELGYELVVLTNGGDETQEHCWKILELVRRHYR